MNSSACSSPAIAVAADPCVGGGLARVCKAAGDNLRLEILQVLRQDSLAVQELCSIFAIRQPAMSHHLKVLAGAGLISRRREGNSIFYRRAAFVRQASLDALQSGLFASIDRLALSPQRARRLQQVQRERGRSSRQFFKLNADKFRAQQDLIASYGQYAETVAQMLSEAPLQDRRLALEVGPGDGAFLSHLAPHFRQVVALDNAAEMLAQAQQQAGADGLRNIEFVHGDTRHRRLRRLAADCIVVNMVLHHTPSPADMLQDLANCLAVSGVLLVTDLCRHDQDWAKASCGDLWLGFEPDDLNSWAERAGLLELASVYLAQRNGFQIQLHLYGAGPAPAKVHKRQEQAKRSPR